jgi:subtilase family serine protease
MSKCKHRVWPGALATLCLLTTALITAPLTHDTGAIAQAETAPDLIVESISWSPLPPTIGDKIIFSVAVRNLGYEPAGDYRLVLFIDDKPLKTVWVYGTEPGETVVKTITWTAEAGPHIARAVANSDHDIDESNENNNENNYAFSVLAPDMVVANIAWVPQNSNVGEPVTFYVTVKNDGNERSAASNVNLIIDGVFRGNRQIPCREAGENETVIYNWVATAGTHEIKAMADCLTQVRESDETNNAKTVKPLAER